MKHEGLVKRLCRRYRWADSPSYSWDDLVQDAMLESWIATSDEAALPCAPSTAVGYAVKRAAYRNISSMIAPVAIPKRVGANGVFREGEDNFPPEQQTEPSEMGPLTSGVTKALAALPERYQDVIRMRFAHDMTLEEVGKKFGFTRERARMIEKTALQMIRDSLPMERVAL